MTHKQVYNNNVREYIAIRNNKQIMDNLSQIIISPNREFDFNVNYNFSIDLNEKHSHVMKKNLPQNDSKEFTTNFSKRYNFTKLNKIQVIDENAFNRYRGLKTGNQKLTFDRNFAIRGVQFSEPLIVPKIKTRVKIKKVERRKKKTKTKKIINFFGEKLVENGVNTNIFELNYEKTVDKIDGLFYVGLKFSSEEVEQFKQLLRVMTWNINLFKIISAHCLSVNSFWSTISCQMVLMGYKKWYPRKCRDSYYCSLNLYQMVTKIIQ
jgi:hypothetical protein